MAIASTAGWVYVVDVDRREVVYSVKAAALQKNGVPGDGSRERREEGLVVDGKDTSGTAFREEGEDLNEQGRRDQCEGSNDVDDYYSRCSSSSSSSNLKKRRKLSKRDYHKDDDEVTGDIFSSPVVWSSEDEFKLYIGCRNNKVYCLSSKEISSRLPP